MLGDLELLHLTDAEYEISRTDGRDAVGMTVGIPKRQTGRAAEPKDELDDLMDALDKLEI